MRKMEKKSYLLSVENSFPNKKHEEKENETKKINLILIFLTFTV